MEISDDIVKAEMEEEDSGKANKRAVSPEDSAEQPRAKAAKSVTVFDTQLLRVYYQRFFPYEQMFRWLSYGNDPDKVNENAAIVKDYFGRREFSFTIENDVYIRYLSFRDCKEMRAEIEKRQPHKIDIGAVYTIPPKNQATIKSAAFKPLERELVFDIDLTDYDDVRVGCTPDMMWERGSWQYMAVAIKIVDAALRQDFGFEHLLWVFSGRRGVHCWVCDNKARQLEDRERTAIVSYLTLITGTESSAVQDQLFNPLHPSLQRAMPQLEEVFETMVCSREGQDLLADSTRWEKVLKLVPDSSVQERLRSEWAKDSKGTSMKRWKQLKATVKDQANRLKGAQSFALNKCIPAIIIIHTYPRLDVNVSTHRNHLLKSPFVIHPKTGKVCVPIYDVENCHDFDPDGVPNLVTLVDELDKSDGKSSMVPIVEGFEKHFLKPLYKTIRSDFADKAQKRAAEQGEW